jgi:outer membrane lipoprotein-sorting protein
MKKSLIFVLFFVSAYFLIADDLVNANDIFNKVSELYSKVYDFQASIKITKGDIVQGGILYYNSRNLLKIEFYNPPGQVILINRDNLQIYLPSHQTILEQKFPDSSTSIASSGGLSLLKNNYMISFVKPGLVSLGEGSSEKVYQLSLYPYAGSKEGFKYIILSVLPDSYLIRRIEAVNLKNEKITFDYESISLNPGIPLTKFSIDTPNLTNVYPNFLYGAED